MGSECSTAGVMAEYIHAAGVPLMFAYPGDPIIDFLEESRTRGIDIVLPTREGTAAFMAEGYALSTGDPSVIVSTLGPGSSSLVNGVAAATWDRAPMIAISGQIDTAREQYFTHQVIDHKQLFSPVSKWAGRVEEGIAGIIMRKALRVATAERPGAVHLTCADDTFRAPASDVETSLPPMRGHSVTIRVERAPGEDADPMQLLAAARRPVMLVGISAMRGEATDALVRLAESAGIPVVVSAMAKGVFPEDHPYFAGVLDMACNQLVWALLHDADFIAAVGFDPVELINPWQVKAPVLHIDSIANTDQIYHSACEVIGDVATILDWLCESWTGAARWSESDVAIRRGQITDAYYAGRVEGRLNPTDVIDVVQAAMPSRTVASCDVGSHKLLIGQGWRAAAPRRVLMSNGLSSMGFGLPAAIGTSIARPSEPIIAFVGDGGFAMTATELRLAASRRLPLLVVVFVDKSLNRIELKQLARGYPSTATRLEPMDLVDLAGAMGCDGVHVETVHALEKVMAEASAITRPLVIDARIDPTQYASQF